MLSVNTNIGAMAALQSLNQTQMDLQATQSHINSGLKVGSPKDNGAVYAIAQNMRGNVVGFQAVNDSINRGVSTSLETNCDWIENFFTPEANLANAALTFWIEALIVPTMVEALAAVEIVEVVFTVTMEPDSFRVWPDTVIFLVPSAEARAWKFAVVPSTMLVPLNDAF